MTAVSMAALLTDQRDAIVAQFVAAVQRVTPPKAGATHSLLVDHIPKFLDEISSLSCRPSPDQSSEV